MAVAPTGAIYKSLIFDGEDSRNYGVYITGAAVYNAPERDVEMITIPGRNGAFALDNGRFENIEVTYPAGIFADTEQDFAQAISDFRNALCSKKGYVRLSDGYNTDEYRMAIYKSGLDVSPSQLKAGEFEITFECKPQRFLISGESAITVENGSTVINPTLFDASPLLEVEGYGSINIGDSAVTIENVPLGEIQLSNPYTSRGAILTRIINLNTGDQIYKLSTGLPSVTLVVSAKEDKALGVSIGSTTNCAANITGGTYRSKRIGIVPQLTTFLKGTSATVSSQVVLGLSVDSNHYTVTVNVTVRYDGSRDILLNATLGSFPSAVTTSLEYSHPAYYGLSTKTTLPPVMYIDLDTGVAYGTVDGEIVAFNNVVTMPAQLPILAPGNNAITYDDANITALRIVPRWWKI